MKLSNRKKSIHYTAAQKNHNLLQYLQNRFSTQLHCDKNLSCFFKIKQGVFSSVFLANIYATSSKYFHEQLI